MAQQQRERKKGGKKLRRCTTQKHKYERYRARIGKPNGPGRPGNKAGKNHRRVGE